MTQKPKLELVWPTKHERARPEPRILIEKQEYFSDKPGINDNLLIQGDNLLGLKALEREYAGKIKCIYIDPPYNTKSCFTHYDDSMEHSMWLDMMRDRLVLLHRLLRIDGTIWISIDDDECHYLKVLCDEVFGRSNFISSIVWEKVHTRKNSSKYLSSSHEYLLCYAKKKQSWQRNLLPRNNDQKNYSNPDSDPRGPWKKDPIHARNYYSADYVIKKPNGVIIRKPVGRHWRYSEESIHRFIYENRIIWGSGDSYPMIKRFLSDVQEGLVPTTLWQREDVGDNSEAKKEVKQFNEKDYFSTPKPERMIERIFRIATNPGDIVLDCFAGSGTTGAVAHKMGRRWIMIELGDHAKTHIIPRLKKVLNGNDPGGITKSVNWQGGGGFKFYGIAPSLLKKDSLNRWSINPEYTSKMLREAMCLHAGFSLSKDNEPWWCHGQSTQQDFIYVTPETLTKAQLNHLSQEVGPHRSLLIFCGAFTCKEDEFDNLKIEKIPKSVLTKCDWDNDDYSLKNSPQLDRSKANARQKNIRLKAAAKSVSARRKK